MDKSNYVAACVVLAAMAAGMQAKSSFADPQQMTRFRTVAQEEGSSYAGTFGKDGVTVTLKRVGYGYRGVIDTGDQKAFLTGAVKDGMLQGSIGMGDEHVDFQAELHDGVLTFTSGNESYDLPRLSSPHGYVAPENDNPNHTDDVPAVSTEGAAKHSAKAAAHPASHHSHAGAAESVDGWKTYRHPTGLSIQYPTNWQVTDQNGAAILTPPDSGPSAFQGGETYMITASSSQGVTTVDDPQVEPYLEGQVTQLAPFLQRSGQTEHVSTRAGAGILMAWEGTNPEGRRIRSVMFTTIAKGYAVSVIGFGDPKLIGKREPILRKIFQSFNAGAGHIDPQLVGTWHYFSYKSSVISNSGHETNIYIQLNTDGTCAMSNNGESSAVFDSGGGYAATNHQSSQGQWSAEDGKLYVNIGGSTGAYAYRMAGQNRLYATPIGSQEKPQEWNRQ